MLRRLSPALIAFAALALVLASSATADKPIKEPSSAQPVTFEGPTAVCAFPVKVTYSAFDNFSITHLDKSGGVRWIGGAGRIVERVMNLTNGKSVAINASGPGKITFNADGSATIDGG